MKQLFPRDAIDISLYLEKSSVHAFLSSSSGGLISEESSLDVNCVWNFAQHPWCYGASDASTGHVL